MYVNAGYLNHQRAPFRDKKRPLRIISAGTYRLYRWPKLPTWRPRGRVDWQLIYVSAGKLYVILGDQEITVPAGRMILFLPKQEQHYYAKGEDKTQYWFVHFTGGQVKNILRHFEIPLEDLVLMTGLSHEYEELFRRMRDELVNCPWGYEEELTYLFRQLLMTIRRRMGEDKPMPGGFIRDEIEAARIYFDEHYSENISISAYAASRHMSTSWFTKNFRRLMGVSPTAYLLELRMRNALMLLEVTDMRVADIAAVVGYENPMYFSRVFRREKGMSPALYRKTYLKEHPGREG